MIFTMMRWLHITGILLLSLFHDYIVQVRSFHPISLPRPFTSSPNFHNLKSNIARYNNNSQERFDSTILHPPSESESSTGVWERRTILKSFGDIGIILPFLLTSSTRQVLAAEPPSNNNNDEDPFAAFGRSLSDPSSPSNNSNWPSSPSPLPTKFSSASEFSSNTNMDSTKSIPTMDTGKSLEEAVQDAMKARKRQIDPRTHG